MARGPVAGLRLLDALAADPRDRPRTPDGTPPAPTCWNCGRVAEARAAYAHAARRSMNLPRQRYLYGRAARLADAVDGEHANG